MAVKTYRKTAFVTSEQFLPAIGQSPKGVYSDGHGDPRKRPDCKWVLDTKEGRHDVRGDDYICTGPAGEQWNVAKEIFEATYEEVSALTPAPDLASENERLRAALGAIIANHETVGAGASIFQCTTAEVDAAKEAMERT